MFSRNSKIENLAFMAGLHKVTGALAVWGVVIIAIWLSTTLTGGS